MTDAIIVTGFENTKTVFLKNRLLIILSAVFIFGLLIGSWGIGLADDKSAFGIREIFSGYYDYISQAPFLNVFLYSLSGFVIILVFCYLSGLCALGVFLCIPLLFFVGFCCGITSGYLYFAEKLSGICFFSVVILPPLFFYCCVLLIGIKQSFGFSKILFRLICGHNTSGLLAEFKRYSLKFLIFIFISVICALIYSGLAVSFSDIFNF